MAVVVQCFHCNAILELDDGFRGGVCRCSGCGSLLQVPKGDPTGLPARAARPAGPPAPAKPGQAPRTQAASADPGAPSSGSLDPTRSADTGGISSGLGRVHQTRPISHVARKSAKPPQKSDTPPKPTGPPDPSLASAEIKAPEAKPTAPQIPAWLATLLLLATAAVVAALGYVYLFHH